MDSPRSVVDDRDEQEMASTESELRLRNPQVSPEVIHGLVQGAYAGLMPAKVHTYLPILITREVQDGLNARTVE
jgi:hypothetical protein